MTLLTDFRRGLLLAWVMARYGLARGALGVRLRQAIEFLGITYIKLGQYLALRTDILPVEICAELDRLFDQATPMPFDAVCQIIEAELAGPPDRYFASIDQNAIGSASVAQVHRAVASNGDVLAVKVQRPGIRAIFAADMRNLRRLARLLDWLEVVRVVTMLEVVDEFTEFTSRELNFILEADAADRLSAEMTTNVRVPRIRRDLTTARLLSMEFVEGINLLQVCDLIASGQSEKVRRLLPGVSIRKVVDDITTTCLRMFFVTGRFHGDPHYGNIMIRRDGKAFFIDWGIYGELPDEDRRLLGDYCENLATGRVVAAARTWIRLSTPTGATDLSRYRRELESVLAAWYRTSRSRDASALERHVARWQGRVLTVMRKNAVRARTDQLLVWRAITILEASSLRLPFRFNLLDHLARFFARVRPGPIQRVLDLLADPGAHREGTYPLSESIGSARRLLDGVARGPRQGRVRRSRPPQGTGRPRLETTLPLTLVAVSIASLVSGAPEVYVRAGGWLVSVFLVTLAADRIRRAAPNIHRKAQLP